MNWTTEMGTTLILSEDREDISLAQPFEGLRALVGELTVTARIFLPPERFELLEVRAGYACATGQEPSHRSLVEVTHFLERSTSMDGAEILVRAPPLFPGGGRSRIELGRTVS